MAPDNAAVLEPTSSTPASTSSISSGTASEALLKAAEAASSPATEPAGPTAGDTAPTPGTGTPSATAPTTVVQPTPGQPAQPRAETGPVPLDRHQAAVRNARAAGAAEAEARYSWAKDINPQDATTAVGLLQEMRTDIRGFWQRLGQELGAGTQGQPPQTPPEEEITFPEADLVTQDGRTKAFSAERMGQYVDASVKQAVRNLMGELQPLMDFYQGETETRQNNEVHRQASSIASSAITQARQLPHFTENEKEIGQRLQQIPRETRAMIGPVAAMYLAYSEVLRDKVFPGINVSAAEQVRQENARKAATSRGSVHPTDQGTPPQRKDIRPGDVGGLAKRMEEMAETGIPT